MKAPRGLYQPLLMSLTYLKEAIDAGETAKLIRYVRLHFGDGDEETGAKEIDKAWIEALKLLLELPPTDRDFIETTIREKDAETLAHLYFRLHFYFAGHSGNWIHDGKI